MEISFTGIRYNYKIFIKSYGKEYNFAVKAIDKKTHRASWINTLNQLLSELDVNYEEERFAESDWMVTKKELKKLVRTTIELFTDKKYLPYFEGRLDEDRYEGEWENIEE